MPDSPSRPDPRHAPYVAVIGPGEASDDELRIAEQVGALLAQRGATVVCGGLGGVMQAACKGAAQHGGPAIGLLPGRDRSAANPYVSVAVATGLGEMRNALVVGSSDGVIAVGGSWGTLSEVALAMRTGKPTFVIGGWSVQQPGPDTSHNPAQAATAQDAVDAVLTAIDDHGPHQSSSTQDDSRP